VQPGLGLRSLGEDRAQGWLPVHPVGGKADLVLDMVGAGFLEPLGPRAERCAPASKAEVVRVLDEIGAPGVSLRTLLRSLARSQARNYRGQLATAAWAHSARTSGTAALVRCDVTTLHFERHDEDELRKVGMSKERPVLHHQRGAIEAHLTAAFAALAVARHLQDGAGTSIKKIVQTLRTARSATIEINGPRLTLTLTLTLAPDLTDAARDVLKRLETGH
jgi:hypothetical protein